MQRAIASETWPKHPIMISCAESDLIGFNEACRVRPCEHRWKLLSNTDTMRVARARLGR